MLDQAFFSRIYEQVQGTPFTQDFTPIQESLNPLNFVVKRDVDGGTSARAMQKMIDLAQYHLEDSIAWLSSIITQQQEAEMKRKSLIRTLLKA